MKKIELKITEKDISNSYDFNQWKLLNNNLNIEIDDALEYSNEMSMETIRDSIVPIVKNCDIFISYSHDDKKIAEYVASILMDADYKVFIDSLFWKSIDDTLIKYDSINSKLNGKLNYEKIRKSSSTFNMILADSLIDTIKSSKVFIFINTGKCEKTPSPWLYLENKIANEFKNELPPFNKFLTEDFNFLINFPLKTNDFYPVDSVGKVLFLLNKTK